MNQSEFQLLTDIETIVCDIAARQLAIPRNEVSPASRILQDLDCDSLVVVELFMEVEEHFGVTIPTNGESNAACKAVFARKDFRVRDLAEVVYLQKGSGSPNPRQYWTKKPRQPPIEIGVPFCQLGGKWDGNDDFPLLEPLTIAGPVHVFRRRSDGMRCMKLPAAVVEIGTDSHSFDEDSSPQHLVQLDSFLIDAETVSTTAYCRFLNSIDEVAHAVLLEWFLLKDDDSRAGHTLIQQTAAGWQPAIGCEALPMILVSWYGANAYSLWANRGDWRNYRLERAGKPDSFLPTEAQWEYAARGHAFQEYPWGTDAPSSDRMWYGQHMIRDTYSGEALPMQAVNATAGMSPFGLHHMAGNVWQWCRDWYDPKFYSRPEARARNAFNHSETGVRSERGGSWVGPAELCRSSHRRGRDPFARGRCLGFRCVSDLGG